MTRSTETTHYPHVVRGLAIGLHPYVALLPRVSESPALQRIAPAVGLRAQLLAGARVLIDERRGFCWVDDQVPCIVLSDWYYRGGSDLDLYLDLLHELTHVRQLAEGKDIWDESLPYVDRPTEIEGYAVAVEEGRRLGMTEQDVLRHLSNPWMTPADIKRLIDAIDQWLRR
jgi:hypothetical protein